MTALLDPAALMQLQMAQRRPEVRWLAGARRGLGWQAGVGLGAWCRVRGQHHVFRMRDAGGRLCERPQHPAPKQAAPSNQQSERTPLPVLLIDTLSERIPVTAEEGLWVDVSSASAFTLAGLLAQAAGEDAVPAEHGRQPGGRCVC